MIYLDHNATTPPHESVLAAMEHAARTAWANPSSVHAAGREARRVVDDARDSIAALAGRDARDVYLTSGGTEANNLGLERVFAGGARGLLVTSRLEHPSVVAYAEHLSDRGVRVVWVDVPRDGRLTPASVSAALQTASTGEPTLVALHAVHHETGVVQPLQALVDAATAHGAEVHVDAVQAVGRVEPHVWSFGHTLAIASHKLRGPKGIGALVTRPGARPHPLLRGGSQERGLRPGTVDAVAAAGFGVAARRAREGGPERYAALQPLRDEIEAGLVQVGRELGVRVEPTLVSNRAPHVAHVLVGDWRGDELVVALDLEGVCVSSGSACTAGTAEPSAALVALVGEAQAARGLRISLGETSSREDSLSLQRAFRRVLARRASPSRATLGAAVFVHPPLQTSVATS